MNTWTDEELEELRDHGNPFVILFVLVYYALVAIVTGFLLVMIQMLRKGYILVINGIRWFISPWVK
jgi:hypothetical protein